MLRDLYVILLHGEPTTRDSRIIMYKTLKGAMQEANRFKRVGRDVRVVRMIHAETLEVVDDNDSR